MNKYITYGKRIDKLKFDKPTNRDNYYLNKPDGGLWASPVDSKWGWKDWCGFEGFRVENLRTSSVFSLKDNARILKIDSLKDFKEVLRKYDGQYSSFGFSRREIRYINWDKLKEDWDAVLLTTQGNYECHLPMDGTMEDLNSWDCESIVILNWDIIDEDSIVYS